MKNKIEELSEHDELLEQGFIKNKFTEIEENIKIVISYFKWVITISGTSLAFFISNIDKEIVNIAEIQITLVITFLEALSFIFFLEAKYNYLCNIKKDLYYYIFQNDIKMIKKISCFPIEKGLQFNFSNFPLLSYVMLFICGMGLITIRFSNFEYNDLSLFIDDLLFYNNEITFNVIIVALCLLIIAIPLVFFCLFLLNKLFIIIDWIFTFMQSFTKNTKTNKKEENTK